MWVRVERIVPGYYNNKHTFKHTKHTYKRDIFGVWVRVERIVPGYYNNKHTFTRGIYLECGSELRGLFQAIIITSIPLQEGHIWNVGQSLEDCSRLL